MRQSNGKIECSEEDEIMREYLYEGSQCSLYERVGLIGREGTRSQIRLRQV